MEDMRERIQRGKIELERADAIKVLLDLSQTRLTDRFDLDSLGYV